MITFERAIKIAEKNLDKIIEAKETKSFYLFSDSEEECGGKGYLSIKKKDGSVGTFMPQMAIKEFMEAKDVRFRNRKEQQGSDQTAHRSSK